jgi:hypothetical protein
MNATTIIGETIMDAVKKFFKSIAEIVQEYKVYKAGKVK